MKGLCGYDGARIETTAPYPKYRRFEAATAGNVAKEPEAPQE